MLLEGLCSVSSSAPLSLCSWMLKSIGGAEMTPSGIHFHQTDGKILEKHSEEKKTTLGFASLQVNVALWKPSKGCRRASGRSWSLKMIETG